jgi:hypothetical protein
MLFLVIRRFLPNRLQIRLLQCQKTPHAPEMLSLENGVVIKELPDFYHLSTQNKAFSGTTR